LAERFMVDVDTLWVDTYLRGGEHAHQSTLRGLGESFQETVKLLEAGVELPAEEYPASKYFLSDLYGKFTGRRRAGIRFCEHYMKLFKGLYESISADGYDTEKSIINVSYLENNRLVLLDGNKRFAVIKYLGKQKEIMVALDDNGGSRKICASLIEKNLIRDGMSEGGKPILYQPIIGYDWCSGLNRTKAYYEALDVITNFCGPVQGKTILDVGSCYGFFCYELAKRGAYAIGVDNDQDRVALSLNLSDIYGFDWSNPKFVTAGMINYIIETGLHFDCVLMLSVLHNMLGVNEELAWATLKLIVEKSDAVVLSMGHLSPKKIVDTQYDIPELIMSHSDLNECKYLGTFSGRHLYGFRK